MDFELKKKYGIFLFYTDTGVFFSNGHDAIVSTVAGKLSEGHPLSIRVEESLGRVI